MVNPMKKQTPCSLSWIALYTSKIGRDIHPASHSNDSHTSNSDARSPLSAILIIAKEESKPIVLHPILAQTWEASPVERRIRGASTDLASPVLQSMYDFSRLCFSRLTVDTRHRSRYNIFSGYYNGG